MPFCHPEGERATTHSFSTPPSKKARKVWNDAQKKDRSYAPTSIGRENVFDDVTIVEEASTTRMTMKILQISRKEGEREEDDMPPSKTSFIDLSLSSDLDAHFVELSVGNTHKKRAYAFQMHVRRNLV